MTLLNSSHQGQKKSPTSGAIQFAGRLSGDWFRDHLPRIEWLITIQGTAALRARLPNPFGLLLMLIPVSTERAMLVKNKMNGISWNQEHAAWPCGTLNRVQRSSSKGTKTILPKRGNNA